MSTHSWRFFRAGGFDQVLLDRGADLAALHTLDQKLWVALACPTRGLVFDPRTLDLIDTDGDGRIRAPDILAVTRWACACLKDPDRLVKGGETLPLAAIHGETPEGRELLAAARYVLGSLGRGGSAEITLADVADTARLFAQLRFNGDGVVTAEAAEDADVAAAIGEIVALYGGAPDRSGKPGVDGPRVDRLEAEATARLAWWDAATRPLGDGTEAAAEAVAAVEAKVDGWFAACRLAAWDSRALAALEAEEAALLGAAAKDLKLEAAELEALPLARVTPGGDLPLHDAVNPAWAARLATLSRVAVTPVLGARERLGEAEWASLVGTVAPYRAWRAAEPASPVATVPPERLRTLLGHLGAIRALIARDLEVAEEAAAITRVEKLLRMHRDLYTLLNNFVSFRAFFAKKEKAVFQAGTLYLDQRSCELCVQVMDAGRHAALAGMSRTYLAYCDCTRKATGESMTIAAAFTDGGADNLLVGRNGVFYDRQGRDWDATIVRIVENPISLRQAFWAPYKKALRLVEEQIAKFAAAKEKEVDEGAVAKVAAGADAVTTGKPGEKKPEAFDVAKFAGIFAAIGLAIGAIGGALGAVLTAFTSLAWWQVPLAIGGVVLAISGPSMGIAWLKLRQRNLGPLLDANGWAVNARAAINLPFGASLTRVASLPAGSSRDLTDPFAEKHTGRNVSMVAAAAAVLLAALWASGLLTRLVPAVPPPPSKVDAPATTEAAGAAEAAPAPEVKPAAP